MNQDPPAVNARGPWFRKEKESGSRGLNPCRLPTAKEAYRRAFITAEETIEL